MSVSGLLSQGLLKDGERGCSLGGQGRSHANGLLENPPCGTPPYRLGHIPCLIPMLQRGRPSRGVTQWRALSEGKVDGGKDATVAHQQTFHMSMNAYCKHNAAKKSIASQFFLKKA